MQHARGNDDLIRFGVFEVDLRTGELRKRGIRLKLVGQAFQVLQILVERRGELVSRDELQQRLWPADTYVDFEHGLNASINRVRAALGDSADNPRFIETLPRRGYRFIGSINSQPNGNPDHPALATSAPQVAVHAPVGLWSRTLRVLPFVLMLALSTAAIWRLRHRSAKPSDAPTLSALPLTSNPGVVAAPSFSPDGNQIVFDWDGENGGKGTDLYVKMIGANAARRLTNHPSNWLFSAWSPQGNYIAFSRSRPSRGAEIVLIAAAGGRERKVADTNADWAWASVTWSPDGKYLALADRDSGDGPYSLYLLSLDTLQRRRITTPPPRSLGDWCPAFSPDGQSLAFVGL